MLDNNYENELRERLNKLSKIDALDLLDNMEWNIDMKDIWEDIDYQKINIINKLQKEYKEK